MNLSYLAGVWYIVLSNFPMWTKGDKIKPNFNYNIETKNGIRGLSDEVKFLKNGKTKSIKGWDRPTDQENTKFIWRGSGLLSIAKSQWEILYRSEDFSWMVIHFEKPFSHQKVMMWFAKTRKISFGIRTRSLKN